MENSHSFRDGGGLSASGWTQSPIKIKGKMRNDNLKYDNLKKEISLLKCILFRLISYINTNTALSQNEQAELLDMFKNKEVK